MAPRPELAQVRDTVKRYLHDRASLEDVEQIVVQSGQTMQDDGMTLEAILVLLKGAVKLAAEHVSSPQTVERAAGIRASIAPWLMARYVNPPDRRREAGSN